ncbi:MAG: hypothetical protein QXW70_00745 [Candidatus Anstonellales archaeon]
MSKHFSLSYLKPNSVTLFIVPASRYININNKILKHFINKLKFFCIYVSVSRSAVEIEKILKKASIQTKNIFYIDAISRSPIGIQRIGNAILLENPKDLTHISIALSKAVSSSPGNKRTLIFVDSLSTLVIYNGIDTVTKFMHYLINQSKRWGVSGAFISVEEEANTALLSKLENLVDHYIKV